MEIVMPDSNKRRVSRKKSISFKPSRKLIENAMEEYLNRGGKITKLEPKTNSEDILNIKNSFLEVDEFLTGEKLTKVAPIK